MKVTFGNFDFLKNSLEPQALQGHIANVSEDGVLVVDSDGRIICSNLILTDTFLYSRGELLGKFVEELVPESLRSTHIRLRSKYFECPSYRNISLNSNLYGICKNGYKIPVQISLNPIKINNKNYVIANIRDLTKVKALELKAQTLANHLPGVVFQLICNQQNRFEFTLIGSKAESLFKIIPSDINIDPCYLFDKIKLHSGDRFEKSISLFKSESGFWRQQGKLFRSPEDVIWIECIANFQINENSMNTWTGIILDVSDKKTAEINLQNEQSKLIHKERLIQMGESIAQVVHDLTSPIGALAMNFNKFKYLNVLDSLEKYKFKEIEELRYILSNCDKIIDKIFNRIDHLRKYSKKDISQSFNYFIIDDLLDDVQLLTSYSVRKAKSTLTINDMTDDKSALLWGNLTELTQVFVNIITNATDALSGRDDGEITLNVTNDLNNFIFEITDNGCGIPEENFNKIFEPYFTTKNQSTGTGIGLSIVRKIVSAHNGEVSFESKQGLTTFKLIFPKKW